MDSITHIVVGAVAGDAFFKKKLGKKALLWGGFAQSVPDFDFLAGFWLPTHEELLVHRGLTHSLFFAILMAPLLAWAARSIHHKQSPDIKQWTLFFLMQMGIHIFLDGFNNYGTGYLEPFSSQRFSLNAIYVVDPLVTIFPFIAAIVLFRKNINDPNRKRWWKIGIILPVVYLTFACLIKWKIDADTRKILKQQNISYTQYFTTPAPLSNWLWFVVAGNDSGYHVGYRSIFDKKDSIRFNYFPRNEQLLSRVWHEQELEHLKRFSQGFYTIEKWNDTLVFNDLRFGQITGWATPKAGFVFHFFLQNTDSSLFSNEIVVQRGRFKNWDKGAGKKLLERMIGKGE